MDLSIATKTPRLVVGVAWVFGSQLLNLVLGLLTAVILARSLGPEGQGNLSVALLIPTVLVLLAGGGLYAANAHFVAKGQIRADWLAGNSVVVAVIGSTIAALVMGAMWELGVVEDVLPGVTPTVLAAAVAILFLLVLKQAWNALLLGSQRFSQSSRADVAQAAAYLGGALLLVGVTQSGVLGGLVAYALSIVAALVAIAVSYVNAGFERPRADLSVLGRALRYGYRGSVGVTLQFFTYRLDLILVNLLIGATAAGHYAISSRLAELLWMLPGAVGAVVFARSSGSSSKDMDRIAPRAFWATAAIGALGAVVMSIIGPLAIPVLFTGDFTASYLPMVILLPGAVLLGSSAVLANDLAGRGRPGVVSLVAGATLVITVILDLSLIPTHGIIGAAAASTVAYSAYFAGVLAMYLRVTGMAPREFVRAGILWG